MKQKICIAVNKEIKKTEKKQSKMQTAKAEKMCKKLKQEKTKKTSTTVLMTAQTNSEKQNKPYREKTLQKAKTARRNRSFGKPSEFWNKIQRFRPLVYAVFPLGAPLINRH